MTALFDPSHLTELLKTFGYIGIASVVFAESGLFFGFFLPGDSLLMVAGILASEGVFNFPILVSIIVIAAVLGDNVGYWFGKYIGKKLFKKEDTFFFKQKHLIAASDFYEKYGAKAIVLARFVPIIRTFVPIVAGVASMNYTKFIRYNVIGGILWGAGVTGFGYVLGTKIPNIDTYLPPLILLIIVISFLPILWEIIVTHKNTSPKK